jgi:hypothetical protein
MSPRWRGIFAAIRKDSSSSSMSDSEMPVLDDHRVPIRNSKKTGSQTLVSAPPCTEKPNKNKSVSFSTLHIRRYNRIIGDNPCCDFPLGLGWRYEDSEPMSLEEYDECHHESNPDYVHAKHMLTTFAEERKQQLYAAGYSECLLRREERRRRLQLLQELFSQSSIGEQMMCDYLPPNAEILVPRYLCERRNPRWR